VIVSQFGSDAGARGAALLAWTARTDGPEASGLDRNGKV
jgi:hypothetical protein